MYINIIIDYMYFLCIDVYKFLLLLCTILMTIFTINVYQDSVKWIFIYKYQTYVLFYMITNINYMINYK